MGMLINLSYPSTPNEIEDVRRRPPARASDRRLNAATRATSTCLRKTLAEQKIGGLLVADIVSHQPPRAVVQLAERRAGTDDLFRARLRRAGSSSATGRASDGYRLVGVYTELGLKGGRPTCRRSTTQIRVVLNLKTAKASVSSVVQPARPDR